jgi:Na+/H+ antiporter NhaD/arsenite permease-like protein
MDREKQFRKRRLIHPIKYNSLSIVLFALFVICMSAQSVVGWRLQNETLAAHGQALIGHWHNLSTGTFLEGLASNWQAAFLQLASLIVFSSFLYQRGAPHSRDPRKAKSEQKRHEEAVRFTWLYRNSLFRAFVLLFVFSLTLHIAFGTNAYNEERALIGQPPISVAAFLLSAKFWSSTLQTWQAEYLAIALFVVLSIFLRQQDSAESKPVESRNQTTGEANMYDTPRTKKPLVIRDRHVGRNTPQQRAVAVPSANLAGVTAFLMQGLRPAG